MAGPFYFAWTGGPLQPPFELQTTCDVWGGSITTAGVTWGGSLSTVGDVAINSYEVRNIFKTDGLVVGRSYSVIGQNIPTIDVAGNPVNVFFTYNGNGTGTLSALANGSSVASQLVLSSIEGTNEVLIAKSDGLVIGRTYDIATSGVPNGTTFTFTGSHLLTISNPCTTTSKNASVKISTLFDRDVLKNVANTSGLIVGQTYNVFCQGVPARATALFDGTSNMVISDNAVVSGLGVSVVISKGASFPDGGYFNPSVHLREDEDVFAIELDHAEGNFPALTVEIRNPGLGLLNTSRQRWIWLSWDTGTDVGIVPLFHGRLIAIPEETSAEIVKLKFIARPEDYDFQKSVLAKSMRVAPFWDPVWVIEKEADPDTVLEARTELWHIDRMTLGVTSSDIMSGEDGTIEITEEDHLYDEFDLNYTGAPLRRINVTADVSWDQIAEGDVDLTAFLYYQFQAVGSARGYPLIASLTGNGLLASWPKPRQSIGGGWSVGEQSVIVEAVWAQSGRFPVRYQAKGAAAKTTQEKITTPATTAGQILQPGQQILAQLATLSPPVVPRFGDIINADLKMYDVLFDQSIFAMYFVVHYVASRQRSEIVTFSLEADVQSVIVEPGSTEQETLSLHSNFVSSPIEANGSLPIGDLRRDSYFKLDRGQESFQYLLMLARAKLLARARVVTIRISTPFIFGINLTCRKNVHVVDRRIPGGEATGKIINYKMMASDKGEQKTEIFIACTVGYGNTVTAAAGNPSYVDNGYMEGGQQSIGAQVQALPGSLVYESFDDFTITDDDGVDFFNMIPENVVRSAIVLGGFNDQTLAITQGVSKPEPDPVGALSLAPTRVYLELIPVDGGPFQAEYSVIVSSLTVPKTIDLEAGAPP